MMSNGYASVCTRCSHLASRHGLTEDAVSVQGPYVCSHRECVCVIDQSTKLSNIDKAEFDLSYAPALHEYDY